jgi:hypothetical protein
VHPEFGRGGKFAVPARVRAIKQVHVPGILVELEDLAVRADEHAGRVPVMRGPGVRHEACGDWHVVFVRRELWNPHDVGAKAGIRILFEDLSLEAPGPAEADPSRRGDEHDDAHPSAVCVERRAQSGRARAEHGMMCDRSLRQTPSRGHACRGDDQTMQWMHRA